MKFLESLAIYILFFGGSLKSTRLGKKEIFERKTKEIFERNTKRFTPKVCKMYIGPAVINNNKMRTKHQLLMRMYNEQFACI